MIEKIKPTKTPTLKIKKEQLQALFGNMAKINISCDKITIELDKVLLQLEK